MLVTSSVRITCLHHTNSWPTLSAAYVCMFNLQNDWVTLHLLVRYLQNHWSTLHVWVSSPKCSVWLEGLLTEWLKYTTLMGTPPLLQTMLVTSSLRITCLHHTNGWPTLSAAYVCMFYLQNDWVTVHLWVRHLQNHWSTLHVWVSNINRCLCLGALPTESLGYTTLIGFQSQVQPMTVMSTYTITGSH